jgi:hypothetical protein
MTDSRFLLLYTLNESLKFVCKIAPHPHIFGKTQPSMNGFPHFLVRLARL